jgi:hypothetical protein
MINDTGLSEKCIDIVKNKEIRFCGIVNNMGRQVVGAYQKGITPLVDSEEHKMCMEYSLGMFITTDLDDALGSTEYIISKRKKVTMISIPVKDHLILISVESNASERETIEKVLSMFKNDL